MTRIKRFLQWIVVFGLMIQLIVLFFQSIRRKSIGKEIVYTTATQTPLSTTSLTSRQSLKHRPVLRISRSSNTKILVHFILTPNVSFSNTRLLFLVISKPTDFKRRAIIRRTWANATCLHSYGAARIFVLGVTSQFNLLDDLNREQKLFGDLLLDDRLVDSYRNLTRKMVIAFHWTRTQKWSQLHYVVKVDADNFVRPRELFRIGDQLRSLSTQPWIVGCIIHNSTPQRNESHKWFVSDEDYSGNRYPDYANGPAYMMSYNALQKLANDRTLIELREGHIFPIEDVFLTGIVRQRENVDLYGRNDKFCLELPKFHPRPVLKAFLQTIAAVHRIDPLKSEIPQELIEC